MAGIAGMYCVDGRPAGVAEVQRMAAAVKERGPDGITYWSSGPVAFAHLQFCTTPESLGECQPLMSPAGEACLVWNGRLDNRSELLEALAARGENPVDRTDPGLVLSAYLLWGGDCVQHLIGDFAMVIWDRRLRQLWCARDYIGVRPFYYFWDGKTFLFGPEIRALLAHPLVSLKINEGMVGEYLANAITSRDETLYADIRRLPSGSTLTIDAFGSLRVASWWNPELSLLQYRTDKEYAEHFRELFDQSVRAQIRCNTPWGIELSGGLDSSSIAATARAVLNESGANDSQILSFSVVQPGKPWDESEDIAAVVEKVGLTAEFLQPLQVDLEFFRQRAGYWRDYPGGPNGEPITRPMYDCATRRGARVLLSGIGGDEWLDGTPGHLVDLATSLTRRGAARELLDRAREDWRAYCDGGHWSLFLARRLLVAAAPDWARARRRKLRLEREGLLSREFLRRTHLVERIAARTSEPRRFTSHAQREVFRIITSGFEAYVLEVNDRESALAEIELRFPFLDRRLAEFCLRLPEDQRQRGAVWKRILRNAMMGRLPERVRTKAYKAEFSDFFHAVFCGSATRSRLGQLAIQRYTDWAEPARLSGRVAAIAEPEGPGSPGVGALWRVLAIDLWLETVINSSGAPTMPASSDTAAT